MMPCGSRRDPPSMLSTAIGLAGSTSAGAARDTLAGVWHRRARDSLRDVIIRFLDEAAWVELTGFSIGPSARRSTSGELRRRISQMR